MKPRLLLASYGPAGVLAITRLLAEGWTPDNLGLLTYDREDNQYLVQFARGRGIIVNLEPINGTFSYHWIKQGGFDYLLSLHYRDRIPASILDFFPNRAMNLHGGRLPEFRGCWSPSWALINGKKETGFTYHYMTPKFDDGNIIQHRTVLIEPTDTAYSLFHRILVESMDDFIVALNLLIKQVEGFNQANFGTPHYYNRDIPFGGYIQPGWSDVQIDRYIRAMYFPPKTGALLKLPDGTEREVLTMHAYRKLTCRSV